MTQARRIENRTYVVEVKRESEDVTVIFDDLLSECMPIRARHSSIQIMMKIRKEKDEFIKRYTGKNQEYEM